MYTSGTNAHVSTTDKLYKYVSCFHAHIVLPAFCVLLTGMLFTANEDPKMNTFYIPVSAADRHILFIGFISLNKHVPQSTLQQNIKRIFKLTMCTVNLTLLCVNWKIPATMGKGNFDLL